MGDSYSWIYKGVRKNAYWNTHTNRLVVGQVSAKADIPTIQNDKRTRKRERPHQDPSILYVEGNESSIA